MKQNEMITLYCHIRTICAWFFTPPFSSVAESFLPTSFPPLPSHPFSPLPSPPFPFHPSPCRFAPYFVEPVIAGLDSNTNEPYIATMDLIGCPMETDDFVVSGTCSEQMYGMCESLWRPDLVSDVSVTSATAVHTYSSSL